MLKALKLSRATGAALAVIGVSWGTLAALVPDLKMQTGLDQAGLGMALLFAAAGGFVSMYAAPKLVPKIGPRALPILAVLVCLALFLPGKATGLLSLGAAFFAMGLSIAILDMGANMRIAETEAETGQPLMNVNHGIYSLIFALSALGAGFMRGAGFSPSEVFAVSSALVIAFALLAIEKNASALSEEKSAEVPLAKPLPWLPILLTAVMFFAAFIGENAIEAWTALYLEAELNAPVGKGSHGPFAFGFVMAIGRFGGQFAVQKFGPERLVFISGLMGALGALGLALAPNPSVAIAAIGLAAIGMSTVVPNANTLLVKFAEKGQRGLVLSRAWMVGFVGFFIGPSMIGFIAEATSLRVAFGVVALLIAMIMPAVTILRRLPKVRD